MNKRKTLLLALAACMIAILAVGGTLAYFTAEETVTNTFTVGDVQITLTESEVTADPTEADPAVTEALAYGYFDADGADARTITNAETQEYETLLPGATVHKDPMVTNTGTNDAYIRVKVTHNNVANMKKAANDYYDQLVAVIDGCTTDHTYSATESGDSVTHVLLFTKPLAADGTIEIFNSIPVPSEYDNTEMDEVFGDLEIKITAEAIQSTGFADAATAFVAFDAQ